MTAFKLGRKATRFDYRTFQFGSYLTSTLPVPPATSDYASKVPTWPMMLNDKEGNCTIAAAGHLEEVYSLYGTGTLNTPSDASIQAGYIAVTKSEGAAYNPATGANDNGCAMLDVLNYWRKTGIGGRKITAFAAVSRKNTDHLKQAVYLFGGLYLGLDLPVGSKRDGSDIFNKPWVLPAKFKPTGGWAPGSLGGHAVSAVKYDAAGIYVVTWGGLRLMSWDFWAYYGSEAYTALSPKWTTSGKSPTGFLLADLLADVKLLAA